MERFVASRLTPLLLAAALIASACSGESNGDAGTGDDTSVDPAVEVRSATTLADDTTAAAATDSTDVYVDPRGDIFTEFEAGFDRTHPFQSVDSFCLPHDEAAGRIATEPGIEADTIQIHHIRQELEKLIGIGFGVEVGDPADMFDTFVDVINEDCGGIRGRKLELTHTGYDPLSPDIEQARTAACLSATEDHDAAFVMSSTGLQGTANLCIAEDHDTAVVTTLGAQDDFLQRGRGNLITFDFSLDDSLRHMVDRVAASGALEGKVIGVVGGDTPGEPEPVEVGLIATLEAAGYDVAVHDTISCGGGTSCTLGVQESVGNMKTAGVDVVFPTLNVLSLPGYVAEMVTQGFEPGDVQFYTSNFSGQAGDLVSSKVRAFGGEAAGALYHGTVIVDSAATGNQYLDGWPYPRFNQLCADTYADNGGESYDFYDPGENTILGMVGVVCSEVRVMARAIYDAGDNPTRDDIRRAIADLGPVDANSSVPMSFGPDKYSASDATQTLRWTSPCEIEGAAFDENDTCVVPDNNYELVSG